MIADISKASKVCVCVCPLSVVAVVVDFCCCAVVVVVCCCRMLLLMLLLMLCTGGLDKFSVTTSGD